jgi:hypothetical protein
LEESDDAAVIEATNSEARMDQGRRRFIALFAGAVAAQAGATSRLWAAVTSTAAADHPTPRPGITAEKVATKEQLAEHADAIPVFDMVRQIPEVVDGIRCNCGCAERKENYSLLSCYEGADAMAAHCTVCQGQGRLAFRLHKAGKTLDEIRKAVDARYG